MNMLKNMIRKHYVPSMLIIGICGSILFLLLGYCVSGAFPSVVDAEGNTVGFDIKLLSVLAHPLQTEYNRYTPIVMLLSFVVFEMIFFILMVTLKRKDIKKEDTDNDSEIEDDLPLDLTDRVMQQVSKDDKNTANTVIKETDEDMPTISEDLFMDLNGKYSIEQITEMMKVSKYIEAVNATLLSKMFKPSMSAEEIHSYIEMFYG